MPNTRNSMQIALLNGMSAGSNIYVPMSRCRKRTASSNASTAPFSSNSFASKMRETIRETVEALKADLDALHVHYNTERRHLGYRNHWQRPIETINLIISLEY